MHIAVMGAGSLGLLLASKLSVIASSMEIITRTEEQADAIRKEGLSIEGEFAVPASKLEVVSYENRSTIPQERADLDYLLLTVKQSSINDELISFMMNRISPQTTVVCFQNGIGHEDKLLMQLDRQQLMLAVTTEGARKIGPAQVAHTGRGLTDLGYSSLLMEEKYPKSQKIFGRIMETAGFEVSLSKNMGTKVWSKLIINSVINPLTAVLRVRNGELLRSSSSQALMLSLYREGIAVAQAKQVEVPDNLWETILLVCERTADNHSSMLQDIMQGRSTEIESINGSLLSIAEEAKLVLPVNQTVYHMVKALENK